MNPTRDELDDAKTLLDDAGVAAQADRSSATTVNRHSEA